MSTGLADRSPMGSYPRSHEFGQVLHRFPLLAPGTDPGALARSGAGAARGDRRF